MNDFKGHDSKNEILEKPRKLFYSKCAASMHVYVDKTKMK